MQFLNETVSMAFYSKPLLLPMLIFKMIKLSIEHGTCELSCMGFCGYGTILVSPSLDDIDGGYQYGHVGVELMRKFEAEHVRKNYKQIQMHFFPWIYPHFLFCYFTQLLPRLQVSFYGNIAIFKQPFQCKPDYGKIESLFLLNSYS